MIRDAAFGVPLGTTTASSGGQWRPREVRHTDETNEDIDREISEATPLNGQLIRWAGRPENQPPEAWWDDESDPFEPERDLE